MKKYKKKAVIVRSCVNVLLPLSGIYGCYVIFHGNSSPGGGFQGGVLVAAAVLLVYLGYGGKALHKTFSEHFLHSSEAIAEIIYVLIALLGIFAGTVFCFNYVFPGHWLETSVLMNDAVGYHVMAGIAGLLLLMLSSFEEPEAESTDKPETAEAAGEEGAK